MTIFPAGSYRDKVYFQHFFKKTEPFDSINIVFQVMFLARIEGAPLSKAHK